MGYDGMSDSSAIRISRNGRAKPPIAAVPFLPRGVSGNVVYDNILYYDDEDRAWQGWQRDKTIKRMLNDPIISAAITGIEMAVRRITWTVKPATDTPEAIDAAEFVQSCLDDMAGQWPGE